MCSRLGHKVDWFAASDVRQSRDRLTNRLQLLYRIIMKNTYSVTQAQSKLPGLLREVNETATTYGITVHDDVKGYLIGKERFDVIIETLEILSNKNAAAALRDYEAGKMDFHGLSALEK